MAAAPVFRWQQPSRPAAAGVMARFKRLRPGEAVISVITYGHLLYGVEKSRFREQATR
jgi:predicted nucleic acid-binding protein